MRFAEIATIPEQCPLELWAGAAGEGFDGRIFLATGSRKGGLSRIFSYDEATGEHALEHTTQAETFAKLRDGIDPQTSEHRLWCFHEGPKAGESWLCYRLEGSPAWRYEAIPHAGNAVGGRGLLVDPSRRLVACGGSDNWGAHEGTDQRQGRAYVKGEDGVWRKVKEITPGLLWETECEGPGGAIWAFWSAWRGTMPAHTFRDGIEVASPPGGEIIQAAWFNGHMYAGGDFHPGSPRVWRFAGGAWREVLDATGLTHTVDHLVAIPRGDGELWVTGQGPFGAGYSLDGVTWHPAEGIPPVDTGRDTNHLTALAYYRGRVWIAARDAARQTIRVFREEDGTPVPTPLPTPPGPDGEIPRVEDITILADARDVGGWPETSRLTRVLLPPRGQKGIRFEHTKSASWPTVPTLGKAMQGNVWLIAQSPRDGRWYAATWEWLGSGQVSKGLGPEDLASHIKRPEFPAGWVPAPGSLAGIMVSTPARNNARTINERSNVEWLRWP